jgi:hypothetical protein
MIAAIVIDQHSLSFLAGQDMAGNNYELEILDALQGILDISVIIWENISDANVQYLLSILS